MNQNGPLIFMCTVPQLDNIEKQVASKKVLSTGNGGIIKQIYI